MQVVALEVRVDFAQDRVGFEERRHRATGCLHREVREDVVAEIPGVAEVVPCGKCRGVRGRERRKQRVAVDEIHALIAQPREGGRSLLLHDLRTQSVGDEENEVMR